MPTYVCSVPTGLLNDHQKQEIATAIGNRHCEATGAPTSFVQVEIDESPSRSRYLGGTKTSEHIWVRGDIRAGRPVEKREQLMLAIMEDIERIAKVGRRDVWVYLCNLEPTDMVEYGHVLPKPGDEQAWLDKLPTELKGYLAMLGVDPKSFTL